MKTFRNIFFLLVAWAALSSPCWAYLDLTTNTWMTRDPLGQAAGPNPYTYVGQNDWTKTDPNGLTAADFVGGLITGVSNEVINQAQALSSLTNPTIRPYLQFALKSVSAETDTINGQINKVIGADPGSVDFQYGKIGGGTSVQLGTVFIGGPEEKGMQEGVKAIETVTESKVVQETGDVLGASAAKDASKAANAAANGGKDAQIVKNIAAPGKFDAVASSSDHAKALVKEALPDAVELPPAQAGAPYPSAPAGVKTWLQVHPAEPGVGNDLPHVKYVDWSAGKKGTGGSWGHVFFPSQE